MGKASRDKGAAFERRICKIMGEAYGVELRRTPLSGGWAQHYDDVAGDVVAVKGEFPYCVECKNQEGWKLESLLTEKHAWFDAWWNQLIKACPADKMPLLIFSRNFAPEYVAMRNMDISSAFCPNAYIRCDDRIIALLKDFIEWDTNR